MEIQKYYTYGVEYKIFHTFMKSYCKNMLSQITYSFRNLYQIDLIRSRVRMSNKNKQKIKVSQFYITSTSNDKILELRKNV